MRNFIVTLVNLILIILFACLKGYWEGCLYFAVSFLLILSIYWFVVFIINYRQEYIKDFKADFKDYCIQLINSSSLTKQDIMQNEQLYKKKYKRSILKYKMIDMAKILVMATMIILSILGYVRIS